MEKSDKLYARYVQILKEELLPAMGCTEPIAVAFAAAKAREILGTLPERTVVEASGNLIKNVKSVTVPNTDGMKGIEAAVAAGMIAGRAEKQLEVISKVSASEKRAIAAYVKEKDIKVRIAQSDLVFDLAVTVFSGPDTAKIRIVDEHTNIVLIEKNGEKIFEKRPAGEYMKEETEKDILTVDRILDFAKTCDLEDVKSVLKRQIQYNSAIAEEGLKKPWGANIGRLIWECNDHTDVRVRAKAKAAAGSDARMSGCEMPAVINAGSGNQGITVTLPVLEYAKELKSTTEELYRALILANLLGLHQKAGIGRLSAYCGAVSAGCAAGAGIAFLMHENDTVIKHVIVNCLAITSGIICDGAKPSCAAKIASSVDAALLALAMAQHKQQFRAGEGIVKKGVENTICSVGRLGKDGMRETDKEILRIMTEA
ncbi:MAG: hypothetical protein DBY17_04385 [Oscillospiraceae bacterium]|nr:MAG: hypothetical protein DBY17_04385 [Oscillospiraceae bacterium]